MTASSISGKTTVCGIIGDPIEHSLSPAMHNAAFREMGLDYVYVPFRVARERLGGAIDGMRALGLRGLNVTVPHKVDVIPLLDEIDSLAGKIGAVNTIVNGNGFLTGYNTDAAGFLRALLENGFDPEGKRALVIGAGGAARAIVFALVERKASVTVLNRTPLKAGDLADRVGEALARASVTSLELSKSNLQKVLVDSDLVVNTTSVGMTPHTGESPLPGGLLQKRHLVFDIVYSPLKTRLLREAEEMGARVITGLEMLVYQGAAAFEKWTGQPAPVPVMKRALLEAMRED